VLTLAKIQDRTQPQARVVTQSHPTAGTFVKVGAVLFVITAIEFGIVSVTGLGALIIAILFLLSAAKFFLVVSYFMHLKWDSRLLAGVFVVGVLLALLITTALKFVNLA